MYVKRSYQKPSSFRRIINSIWKYAGDFGKDFCTKTSIHGFNQIAFTGRHWIERLLWLGVTAVAICGAVGISLDQWQRYDRNPTVVALEKNFRSWRFSLPAVTACPKDKVDPVKIETVIKKYWAVSPGAEKYTYYSRFIDVVANSEVYHLGGYAEFKEDQSLNVDLFQLVVDVMPEVAIKIISSEDAKAVSFKWIPVMTESGVCFSTNSLAIGDVAIMKEETNLTMNYPVTCKYSSQTCYVMFEVVNVTKFYSHSPYDIMDTAKGFDEVFLRLSRTTQLIVIESSCGKGVRELNAKRRGCLFYDEPLVHSRKVYSTNTCRMSCRSQHAVKLCGCKPFYYFYEEGPLCSTAGMACIAEHIHEITNPVRCTCIAQCLDAVFQEIATKDNIWENGPFITRGSMRYVVQIPRTRYIREIVFYFQDLIVSFGGAAGLFLGASFISFVEVLYFMGDRIFRHLFQDQKHTSIVKFHGERTRISYEARRVEVLTKILEGRRINEGAMKFY